MTKSNRNTYHIAYNFIRGIGNITVKSLYRICDFYGMDEHKEKLRSLIEEIRVFASGKAGKK